MSYLGIICGVLCTIEAQYEGASNTVATIGRGQALKRRLVEGAKQESGPVGQRTDLRESRGACTGVRDGHRWGRAPVGAASGSSSRCCFAHAGGGRRLP